MGDSPHVGAYCDTFHHICQASRPWFILSH